MSRQFNGTAWSSMTPASTTTLRAIWGSGSNDLIAVGDGGTVAHYNGGNWTTAITPTTVMLKGVWGSGASDRFAVGTSGVILHKSSSWTIARSEGFSLHGVHGRSGTDVFAVGNLGTILHYDGVGWHEQHSGAIGTLQAVWTDAQSRVFVVGYGGVILSRP